MNKFISENIKTLIYALIIALFIRSILIQPFYIPSSSMEPNLLVGDRLFVTKFSYGYSKHSFPFSPNLFQGRILYSEPKRGDVVVFKTPADNRTDYIKRLIGIPGDELQFIDGNLIINNELIFTEILKKNDYVFCGSQKLNVRTYQENINNKKYNVTYSIKNSFDNSDLYIVPKDHYFFLGDNRDCSKDSRFLSDVGYVHKDNLVGKAQFLFFSSDRRKGSVFAFWKWNETLRFERFLKKIR